MHLRETYDLAGTAKVNRCFGLHQVKEAFDYYKENMTEGKCFLKPSLTIRTTYNVMVIGDEGAGKKSLIKAAFGNESHH